MTQGFNPSSREGGAGGGDEFTEQIVAINRTAKVVKGGRRFSFSAIVVVGDRSGRVGVALGKANEVPEAIRKAGERARRTMVRLPLVNGTLPHEVVGHFGATRILLKPASPGTGVIAGSALRLICDAAGIRNVLSKIMGSRNPHNVTKAAMEGLRRVKPMGAVFARRGRVRVPKSKTPPAGQPA